jgi:hypothetical protein
MSKLHLRIKLNPGGIGARLDKLADVSSKADIFLRALAADVNLEMKKGELLALDFKNASIEFAIEYVGTAEERKVNHYNKTLKKITEYNPREIEQLEEIKPQTIKYYADIAESIEQDEKILFGIYENGSQEPAWQPLSKQISKQINESLLPIEYEGGIQAIIHSIFIEIERPYFKARELSSETLITCYYKNAHYDEIIRILETPHAIVHLTGTIKASKITRKIEDIKIKTIARAPHMAKEELLKFFGSAPDFTGELSTSDFINRMRSRG